MSVKVVPPGNNIQASHVSPTLLQEAFWGNPILFLHQTSRRIFSPSRLLADMVWHNLWSDMIWSDILWREMSSENTISASIQQQNEDCLARRRCWLLETSWRRWWWARTPCRGLGCTKQRLSGCWWWSLWTFPSIFQRAKNGLIDRPLFRD